MRLLPGGLAAAQGPVCPACEGARCHVCSWEGTREGYQQTVDATTLQEELSQISDAQLSMAAVQHSLSFTSKFRSPQARYVSGLLREVLRRADVEVEI